MGTTQTGVLVFVVVLCMSLAVSKKIPDYITLCHRNDPQIQACIKRAVEQIRPHLAKGIPDLLIPPVNPLVIPKASLDSGNNFRASFSNIRIFYADEFVLNKLDFDLDKAHLDLSIRFPRLRILSEYNINGRLLILELNGNGPADGNFTNVGAELTVDGGRYTRKGREYYKFSDRTMQLDLGKPVFRFDNIFGDNQELNDQTNKVVNENIVDILDELRPVIDETITQFLIGVIERIFSRFSIDELFPK